MTERPHFCQTLQTIMSEKGISQNELSRTAGIDQGTISKMVHGQQTRPTWETVQRIAAALGVPCTAFADPSVAAQ